MATIRDGGRKVLMVVDVQQGVMRQAWDAERIISNVARVVDRARSLGVAVIWVQHADDELPEGNPEWQWVSQLKPEKAEAIVHKHYNSSFEDTKLEEELEKLGATHIILSGAATNWCIRATAYGALDRGYDLTLVSDAHTTETMDLGNGAKVEARSVISDLNATMAWLSYPGRSNSIATAEEVFALHG